MKPIFTAGDSEDFTTLEVARLLGMSVRSVQLMVDRGELEAWKTPGGHRRIARASVEQWRRSRATVKSGAAVRHAAKAPSVKASTRQAASAQRPCVLVIDDSIHFQKLISLLVRQRFPEVDLHVADDGIAGLAMYGQLQPQVLIVDILLPGIDGATLIMSLRSHPQFTRCRLAVVTSLNESECAPYAFALEQVPVIHKPRLVAELPVLLEKWLPARRAARGSMAGPS